MFVVTHMNVDSGDTCIPFCAPQPFWWLRSYYIVAFFWLLLLEELGRYKDPALFSFFHLLQFH